MTDNKEKKWPDLPVYAREELEQLNRELMIINADYADIIKKLESVGKKIFELYEKIDNQLNKKEQ